MSGSLRIESSGYPRESRIRVGVCGTPLIVDGKNLRDMRRALRDSVVAGFMLSNNIEGRYDMDPDILLL